MPANFGGHIAPVCFIPLYIIQHILQALCQPIGWPLQVQMSLSRAAIHRTTCRISICFTKAVQQLCKPTTAQKQRPPQDKTHTRQHTPIKSGGSTPTPQTHQPNTTVIDSIIFGFRTAHRFCDALAVKLRLRLNYTVERIKHKKTNKRTT